MYTTQVANSNYIITKVGIYELEFTGLITSFYYQNLRRFCNYKKRLGWIVLMVTTTKPRLQVMLLIKQRNLKENP